mmetsp:Transcript_23926/g.66870  ORF Transcript_23926/g.66870 Transcript_23926/m.66870 type:complete len:209 (-) Transcript_23926:342-968(-)
MLAADVEEFVELPCRRFAQQYPRAWLHALRQFQEEVLPLAPRFRDDVGDQDQVGMRCDPCCVIGIPVAVAADLCTVVRFAWIVLTRHQGTSNVTVPHRHLRNLLVHQHWFQPLQHGILPSTNHIIQQNDLVHTPIPEMRQRPDGIATRPAADTANASRCIDSSRLLQRRRRQHGAFDELLSRVSHQRIGIVEHVLRLRALAHVEQQFA